MPGKEHALVSGTVSFRNRGQVRRIYNDVFPNDRMPFWFMSFMMRRERTDLMAFSERGSVRGIACLASIDGLTFIMFLAVDPDFRSQGYGGEIIDIIRRKNPKDKLLVSFDIYDRDAQRRRDFYSRHGFRETGYAGRYGREIQEIMVCNGKFDPNEFSEFFRKYGKGTMNPELRRL